MTNKKTVDAVLDYLMDANIKKLWKLDTADIEKKLKIGYYTLAQELPDPPMIYLERIKAFRTVLELSQQKKYREMPVEKLSRALGFSDPKKFQSIFTKYTGMTVETCQKKLADQALMILKKKRKKEAENKQQAKATDKRREARERRRQARERKKTTARVKNKRTAKG